MRSKLSRRICLLSSNLPHGLEVWATCSPRGLPMLLHGRILRVSALSRVTTGRHRYPDRQEKPFSTRNLPEMGNSYVLLLVKHVRIWHHLWRIYMLLMQPRNI